MINPETLGYSFETSSNRLTIELDVRTIFSALSISYQVNGVNTLDKLSTIKVVIDKVC